MKTLIRIIVGIALALVPVSCEDLLSGQTGTLHITFQDNVYPPTRTSGGIPDTDDFILTVTDSKGSTVYDGRFGSSPDDLIVSPGTYTVSAVSCSFTEPAFDSPQYGDTEVVVVSSGSTVNVELDCVQLNSGLRLEIDSQFKSTFPDGVLYLKGDGGTLMYTYSESRTAFFSPGNVTVSLSQSGMDQALFTRTMKAQQMVKVGISASVETTSGGVSIQVDTTREWLSDSYVYGKTGGEGSMDSAYSPTEARNHIGDTGVWVSGYIVGVATNTGKFSFEPPFTKNTNLVIGNRSTTTDSEYCLTVELKAGDLRNDLNLVDNPSNLGRRVYLKGDLVSAYYGIPGLKNVSEYKLQ